MSARAWAETVRTPVKWGQLEVEAFAGHPDIREQLDPTRRYGRFRGGAVSRQLWWAVPAIVLLGAAFLAPIVGFAILLNGRYGMANLTSNFAVPVGSILFGVGIPSLLLNVFTWLVIGLRWSRLRALHAGTTLGVGIISVPVIVIRGSSVAYGPLWIWIVVLTTLVARRESRGHRLLPGS